MVAVGGIAYSSFPRTSLVVMGVLLILILGFVGKVFGDSNEDRKFAADLYSNTGVMALDNFVVSPLSVKMLLALIDLGAGGKTAEELSKGIGLPNNSEDIQEYIMETLQIFGRHKHFKLKNDFKIYVDKKLRIHHRFKNLTKQLFHTQPIEEIDFKNVTNAAEKINTWITDHTHTHRTRVGKYNYFDIDGDGDDYDKITVLVNAFAFEGFWEHSFDILPKKQIFYWRKEGNTKLIMMHTTSLFKYSKSKRLGATFLELPFKGNITLTIVLPHERTGLDELKRKIHYTLAPRKYSMKNVSVTIPLIEFETGPTSINQLERMGIREAFNFQKANFSGISDDRLAIVNILQFTYFMVDEELTVGGTYTSGDLIRGRGEHTSQRYKNSKTFRADHPFLFYVTAYNRIAFLGHFSGYVSNGIDNE